MYIKIRGRSGGRTRELTARNISEVCAQRTSVSCEPLPDRKPAETTGLRSAPIPRSPLKSCASATGARSVSNAIAGRAFGAEHAAAEVVPGAQTIAPNTRTRHVFTRSHDPSRSFGKQGLHLAQRIELVPKSKIRRFCDGAVGGFVRSGLRAERI